MNLSLNNNKVLHGIYVLLGSAYVDNFCFYFTVMDCRLGMSPYIKNLLFIIYNVYSRENIVWII